MKKYLPLYLYGAVIICTGIFLLVLHYYPVSILNIRVTLGGSLIFGAFLAFITAFSLKQKHVQFAYHEMHAMAMLVYGILILLFCNTLERLVYFTNFLFFYYTFSEIIFCSWLYNLGQKVVYKILFVRLILGFLIGIGTVVLMQNTGISMKVSSTGFGALFIIIGINILLYVPILKVGQLNAIKETIIQKIY